MTQHLVRQEVVERVAVLSFDRPARHNAVNDALAEQWAEAMLAVLADPDVRCVLLRGEGPSFCSGRDTAELGMRPDGESDHAFVLRHQEIRVATLESPKPIVAAVQGHALGGGFEIALSADVRIAADDARFGFPEIGFGLVADTGGTQLLTVLAGPSRAKWLLLSGATIDAGQALAWGIVDWVVPPDELAARALEMCHQLAAAPPMAAAFTKQLVDGVWAETVRAGMGQEALAQATLFAGDEHREAKSSRLADGAPVASNGSDRSRTGR